MGRETATIGFVVCVMALVVTPLAVFIAQASGRGFATAWEGALTPAGVGCLTRTVKLMAVAGSIGTLYGWVVGGLLSLHAGGLRRLSLAVLAMPVICPPFLWAVGVQGWKGLLPFKWQIYFDGFSGHVIASAIVIGALTAFITATRGEWITRSAVESVLLSRGSAYLYWMRLRSSWQTALGAGLLGTLIVAGDAGTGQMMGYQGLSGVIHSAFVTEHDFSKAASRALVTLMILLPMAAAAALLLAKTMMARRPAINGLFQSPCQPCRPWLLSLASVPLLIGLVGFIRPLFNGSSQPAFRDAFLTLQESLLPTGTLLFSVTAILMVAVIPLGKGMARHPWLWRSALCVGFLLLAIPQSIHGLGWLLLRGWLPLSGHTGRSLEVALVLSSRWVLVGAHLAALSWQSLPSSALDSMRVSGCSWRARSFVLCRPLLLLSSLPVALCTALISLGDASSIVLLQAPGWATYATRLFSIMDNAPERQIAAMCLVYLAVPCAVILVWQILALIKSLRP